MKKADFENKRVMVFGWARSGKAAAHLLSDLKADVLVVNGGNFDSADTEYQQLVDKGVRFIANDNAENLDESYDYLIKNPGIKYDTPLIKKALELGVPVITEVEVALSVFEGRLIAVTGSNGKTTTTSLIRDMLKGSGQHVITAGNIGTPVSEVVEDSTREDTLLLELSSFQLMGLPDIQPDIALITNIFSNHLDYHGTRERYVEAKFQITKQQTADQILVLNDKGEDTNDIAGQTSAKVVRFASGTSHSLVHIDGQQLVINNQAIMPLTDIKLVGQHNLENIVAAATVATLAGANSSAIAQVLRTFGGVEHRLEYVLTNQEVKFYNDSKATDIEASQTALDSFKSPTIWLAGGLDRGDDLMRLVPNLEYVKLVIAFGETQQKIVDVARAANKPVIAVTSVKEAVPVAVKCASAGDVVLLSPAAASWDQYPNFEVRGHEYVNELKKVLGV